MVRGGWGRRLNVFVIGAEPHFLERVPVSSFLHYEPEVGRSLPREGNVRPARPVTSRISSVHTFSRLVSLVVCHPCGPTLLAP